MEQWKNETASFTYRIEDTAVLEGTHGAADVINYGTGFCEAETRPAPVDSFFDSLTVGMRNMEIESMTGCSIRRN